MWTPEEIALTRYAWALYDADRAQRRLRMIYHYMLGLITFVWAVT